MTVSVPGGKNSKSAIPPTSPHSSSDLANGPNTGGGATKRAEGGGSTKQMICKVALLDDSVVPFQVPHKSVGKILFDQICQSLNLLETDYFGVEYFDTEGNKCWLDNEKFIIHQVGISGDVIFKFCVKFYTPDPTQLEEEYTRYLFCLQLKRDLADGSTTCSENTTALLASYIVQADCGDFSYEDYPDHTYLSGIKFVPKQTPSLEVAIMENHKRHAGQTPAEADLNFLDIARRVEMYGIKMHPAQDHEGVGLNLAVAHMGILVYQNQTRINTFSWAKIRKLSFKRKKFLIKLHPEEYGYYKDTVEFYFHTRNQSKNFWKKCIEHHTFFRVFNNFPISAEKAVVRHKRAKLFSKGSSFRYSGRTQKEIVAFVRESFINRQPFTRSMSSHLSIKSAASPNAHLKGSTTTTHHNNTTPSPPLADGVDGTGLGHSLATPAGVPYYVMHTGSRSETRLSKTSSTSGSHLFDTSADDLTHGQHGERMSTSFLDQNTTNTISSSIPHSISLAQSSSRDEGSFSLALNESSLPAPPPGESLEAMQPRKITASQPNGAEPVNGQPPPKSIANGFKGSTNGDFFVTGRDELPYDRKSSLPIHPYRGMGLGPEHKIYEGHYVRPKSKSMTPDLNVKFGSMEVSHQQPYVTQPSLIQYDPATFVETYAYNLPHNMAHDPSTIRSTERLLTIGSGVPKDERVEIKTSNVMVTKITEKDRGYYDSTSYHRPHREESKFKGSQTNGEEGIRRQSETPTTKKYTAKQNGATRTDVQPRRSTIVPSLPPSDDHSNYNNIVEGRGEEQCYSPLNDRAPDKYFARYDSDSLFGSKAVPAQPKHSSSTPSSSDTTSSPDPRGRCPEVETTDGSVSSSSGPKTRARQGMNGNHERESSKKRGGVSLIRGLNRETIAAQQKKMLEEDIPYVLHVNNKMSNRAGQNKQLTKSQRQSSAESFGYYDTALEESRGDVYQCQNYGRVESRDDVWHPQRIHGSVHASPLHHHQPLTSSLGEGEVSRDKASSISDLPYRMSLMSPAMNCATTGASISLSHIPSSPLTMCKFGVGGVSYKPNMPGTPQPLRRHRTDEEIRSYASRRSTPHNSLGHYESVHGHDHVLQHLPHFTFDLVRLNKLPSKTSFSSLDHTFEPFTTATPTFAPREMAREYQTNRDAAPTICLAPHHKGQEEEEDENDDHLIDPDESMILAALVRSETNVPQAVENSASRPSAQVRGLDSSCKKHLRRSISNPSRGCPSSMMANFPNTTAAACYHASPDYYYPARPSVSTTHLKASSSLTHPTPFIYIDDDNNINNNGNNGGTGPFYTASEHGYCRKDWFQKESTSPRLNKHSAGSRGGGTEEGARRKKSRHRKTRSRSRSSQQKLMGSGNINNTKHVVPLLLMHQRHSTTSSNSSSSSSGSTKRGKDTSPQNKKHSFANKASTGFGSGRGYILPPRPLHEAKLAASIYEGLELSVNAKGESDLNVASQLGPSDYNSVTEADGYSDITIC